MSNLIPKPSLILLDMPRVVACMEWLDKELQPTGEVHTIQTLIARLDILCAALPFINTQMASAQQALRSAKVAAYRDMVLAFGKEKYFSPSLAKDYVDALLGEPAFNYDLAERCSRTLVHLIDATRTAISAIKTELSTIYFTGK